MNRRAQRAHRARAGVGIVAGSAVLTAWTVFGLEVEPVAVVALFGAYVLALAGIGWVAKGMIP